MFKNFIIITLRSLSKHRLYTFINVLGLAVGMACALLISIYLVHETSYDDFHKDGDRIYRASLEGALRGQDLRIAVTAAPMAGTLQEEYSSVESTLRIVRMGAWLVNNNETRYNEDKFYFVDTNFFSFFSFPLLLGDPDSIFLNDNDLVLTQSAAIKYFGTFDVIGKELEVETYKKPFIVRGIVEDIPSNSHFKFDILCTVKAIEKYLKPVWVNNNVYTYLKVKPGTDAIQLEKDIDQLVWKYVVPEIKDYYGSTNESFVDGTNVLKFRLQAMKKIHLSSDLDVELEDNGSAVYIYTFGIIALLILLVACVNFINLSTANSANRAREVVLRKVVGSERKMLIVQFLTESVIFSFGALVLALLLAEIVMPHFNNYLELDLDFAYLKSLSSISIIILFALILGILAGSYPAFFISSYDPVKVLHGILNLGVSSRKVRSVFVVSQFFISMVIILLTLVVFAQVRFMVGMDLGFNKEKVLVIRRPDALEDKIEAFKSEIREHPNIESVTNSNSIPGRQFMVSNFMVLDDTSNQNILLSRIFVSHEFFETYGIELIRGRYFSGDDEGEMNKCIINATAARELGLDSILGTTLEGPRIRHKKADSLEIIGIVKDFNFESVDKSIDPLVITLMPGNWEGYLNVRLSGWGTEKAIKFIKETWGNYTSEYPFLYFFLNDDFNRNYSSFVRIGKILLIFALLSIFVACLGLFGLMLFTINQRTREIGIRKSLGATNFRIIYMVLKETFILVLYSSVLAWISGYILAGLWLRDFSSHITLVPKYFIWSTLIVLALSMIVVLYQALSASRSDPATAIKAE